MIVWKQKEKERTEQLARERIQEEKVKAKQLERGCEARSAQRWEVADLTTWVLDFQLRRTKSEDGLERPTILPGLERGRSIGRGPPRSTRGFDNILTVHKYVVAGSERREMR